ncbi:MAG: transglycosylase domain-containing protein [Myxococcota bacterium]
MDTDPGQPARRAQRRAVAPWLWIVVGLLAVLGVTAVFLSAAVLAGRAGLEQRLTSKAAGAGCEVSLGRVNVDLTGGLRLEGLRLDDGPDGVLDVRLDAVEVDMDPLEAVIGQPRVTRVHVHGGHARIVAGRALADLLADLRGPGDGGSSLGAGGARLPDEVRFDGLSVELAPPPDTPLPTVRATGVSGRLFRREDGPLRLEATGRVPVEGTSRRVTAEIVLGEDPSLRIALDAPLGVETVVGGRRIAARLTGILRRPAAGETRVEGLAASTGDHEIACERLVVRDRGGILPAWADIERARCEDARLRSGRRRGTASSVEVTLEDTGRALPQPRRVRLDELRIHLGAARGEATARAVDVALRDETLAHLRSGDPVAAMEAVTVRGPALQVTLREAARLPGLEAEDEAPAEDPPGEEPEEESRGEDPGKDAARPVVDAPLLRRLRVLPAEALRLPHGARLVDVARGVRLNLDQGHVRIDAPDRPSALRLDDLTMRVVPGEDGGLDVSVGALMVRGEGRSGRVDATLDVDDRGAIRSAEGVLAGTDFAHVLSRSSEYVTVEPEAWVRVDFDYGFDAVPTATHHVRGEVRFEDFGFQAWRISHAPVSGLEGRFDFTASWRPARHHLEIDVPRFHLDDTRLAASLTATGAPGESPRYGFRVTMPRQDCGAAARSIPRALLPRLRGLRLAGQMAFEASLSVDMAEPYGLELRVDGDVEDCRVRWLGGGVDVEDLRDPDFVHHPVEPERGRLDEIAVGPGTDQWVPSEQLPLFLKAAAIVTEDRGWREHQGVRWDLVERALKLDLDKGRFVYGGSTITQQLVKNLYLTREKTLSRKLEELIISWEMERALDKDEILTMYVNVIEYGPDIYGVKAASHHYFAKEPVDLSPAEAAFIMGLKPYPDAGYKQWERQELSPWWVKRVKHVLEMMHTREDAISEAEVLAAAPYQVDFRAPEEPLWGGRPYVPPTVPTPFGADPPPRDPEGDDGAEMDARLPPP